MAYDLSSVLSKLQMLSTSDHSSVASMNLFVALLCACIVIGHLLEENRWMNESITALLIVSVGFSVACLQYIYLIYLFFLVGKGQLHTHTQPIPTLPHRGENSHPPHIHKGYTHLGVEPAICLF